MLENMIGKIKNDKYKVNLDWALLISSLKKKEIVWAIKKAIDKLKDLKLLKQKINSHLLLNFQSLCV